MRIMAYPLHESERTTVDSVVTDQEASSESFVVGSVDKAGMERLETDGIVFEVLPEDDGTRSARPRGPRPTASVDGTDQTRARRYAIHTNGPLLPSYHDALEFDGVEVLERAPDSTYDMIARMRPAQADSVAGLDFVYDVTPYPSSADEAGSPRPGGAGTRGPRMARDLDPVAIEPRGQHVVLTFDVVVDTPDDVSTVVNWLEERNATVLGSGLRKIRIALRDDSTIPDEARSLAEVEDVCPYLPPEIHMERARELVGIEDPSIGQRLIEQTGAGQIIGVADTGIDEEHPDLKPQLDAVFAWGRPGDASDPHGHGTHVAGIAAGAGVASNRTLAGAAPGATVVFQSLLDSSGGLAGLPIDLADLFQQAYDRGVRIHNNSWGSAVSSEYVLNSLEVDEFVAANRDMLVVISAGNEGQAADRVTSDPGVVDLSSITSPASAKNALTVGASRSDRTSGGLSELTYGEVWSGAFPDPPIARKRISGDRTAMAAFSSRGPSLPTRIKPDLVAPGTDIAAPKSSLAPLGHFWGPYAGNLAYAYMGGTSMSAPLVTGCAALTREYYVDEHGIEPSAALLKATLINGTRPLSAPDSMALHNGIPNYSQGFGCVDMLATIPNSSHPQLRLDFVDADQAHGLATADRAFREVQVRASGELRVCLCWTDTPGRSLVNNLDLIVMAPDGQKHMGNLNLPIRFTRHDTENNVEVVRIDDAPAGKYVIVIIARNVLKPPQDYALVAAGNLT